MRQSNSFGAAPIDRPSLDEVPEAYRARMEDLFDTWAGVRERNRVLTSYYDMKNAMKPLGISMPEGLARRLRPVVGWCAKAVHAHAMRSVFDGYVFGGRPDASLDALVSANRMRSLYQQACASALVHGVSAITVMRGNPGQPAVKVRAHSANQFCALWDKDAERVGCGVVLADVDREGRPCRYTAHMPDAVIDLYRVDWEGSFSQWLGARPRWRCKVETHPMGRPLMELIVNDPDPDRPLGHSMLTPELLELVDKAMRDVANMEVGAEFYTWPQRYIVGAAEDLFSAPVPEGAPVDEDGSPAPRPQDPVAKFRAYVGALLAISRDENGDVPTVGQFSPTSAENFAMAYENDAQRFSGATNVPLAQLGVLSNTYTSSDALSATNDPLILEVETMNRRNTEAMEEVARMMMAVEEGVALDALPPERRAVKAAFADPSKPTLAARADAWSKFASIDPSVVGTRVFYEGMGLDQPTIDRLASEKEVASATSALNRIADSLGGTAGASGREEAGDDPA